MTNIIRQNDSEGELIANEDIGGKIFQKVVVADDAGAILGVAANPLQVDGSGVTQPVSGSVDVNNFPTTQPVSGPLTDAELRDTPVPVSGTVDVGNLPATQPVSLSTMPKMPTIFKTIKNVAIGTIVTVWTPASNKKIRLMGGCISVSAAASVLFEDNSAGTDVFQSPPLLAGAPYNFDLGDGVLLSAINNVLKATSSAAANMTGTLYGIEE